MSKPIFAPEEVFSQMLEYGVMPTFDLVLLYGTEGIVYVKRKIPPYQNVWALPGLRMYKGESIDDTLIRIGKQELGITLDTSKKVLLGQFVGKFSSEHQRQDLSTAYLIGLAGNEKLVMNKEHFSDMRVDKKMPHPTGAMYQYYYELVQNRL